MSEVQLVGECLRACLCFDDATRANFYTSCEFHKTTRHILNIYTKRRTQNGFKQELKRKAGVPEVLVREIKVDGEIESFRRQFWGNREKILKFHNLKT